MTDDLQKRLRTKLHNSWPDLLCEEAADALDAKDREIERLTKIVKAAKDFYENPTPYPSGLSQALLEAGEFDE